jgi:hypothetical protein
MPTTPILALPYPVATDTADVPRDIQALANRLDIVAAPPPSSATLPGSPVDGQEHYLQVDTDASGAIVWHLRYRSSSGSSHKWEYAGGAPIFAEIVQDQSGSSGSFGDLTSPGPTVYLPRPGDYDLVFGCEGTTDTLGGFFAMSVQVGAVAATDADSARGHTKVAGYLSTIERSLRKTNLTAAAVTAKYRTGAVMTAGRRWVRATPIRIS